MRGHTHLFAARLARVLVAVAGIFELGAAFKVFENQLVGSATHDRPKGSSGFFFEVEVTLRFCQADWAVKLAVRDSSACTCPPSSPSQSPADVR